MTIECEPRLRETRFAETVEGAAYFTVCEGLVNAVKHSGAERVVVRLEVERGRAGALRVEVRDDGCGFEPAAVGTGTGLGGLADRIEALGGTLAIASAPGAGTAITARLPAEERARA